MTDPIIEKAIARRDEALREAERWETWIRSYEELSERVADPRSQHEPDPLEIPGARGAAITVEDEPLSVPLAVEAGHPVVSEPAIEAEALNGKGMWPRLLGKPIG
jgi:hypothetical protein